MESNIKSVADRYAIDGAMKDILRASGIDYTGDRLDTETGTLVQDTPEEAVRRMIANGCMGETGIAELRRIGIEV
jgi:hypothetical protein